VSKNPDIVEAEPKDPHLRNIHGDEKSGLMVACDALDWILANYASNASAQKLVDGAELWFIPMGNPYATPTAPGTTAGRGSEPQFLGPEWQR